MDTVKAPPGVKLPPGGYRAADVLRRQTWLAEKSLHWQQQPEPGDLKGLIENHIGFMSIPLGIAGPCLIDGSYASGTYYIPLATLEGTLVLSMTRGLYAMALSGGVKTVHLKQELSRSPIFRFNTIAKIECFIAWVNASFAALKSHAESTTNHGKLLRIDAYPIQNSVILDFVYDTAEAAGQNMTTFATAKACDFIMAQMGEVCAIKDYKIESNFNGDKNAAYRNFLLGRGHKVIASAVVRKRVLKRVMRITPEEISCSAKVITLGSQMAGLCGHNLHLANGLSAIYLATGQDVACVCENVAGVVSYDINDDGDLVVSLTMPSLTVGTVGGATRLPQQRQNLQLLGCEGKHASKKLAEIVVASCLGLELSLGCAIATNEFALAHQKYGR